MKKYLILAFATLLLAGCQTTSPTGITRTAVDTPVGENTTRVIRHNINPDKWNRKDGATNQEVLYTCKALACPSPSYVRTRLRLSPTINPDRQALNRLIKVDVPRIIAESNVAGRSNSKIASSSVVTKRGYPATLVELSGVNAAGDKYYTVIYEIFAGNMVIYVAARSAEAGQSRQYANQFIERMEIIQGENIKQKLASR